MYCDGGSFTGTRIPPDYAADNSSLYYRGHYNYFTLLHDVIARSQPTQVLLAGCSAGGMAAALKCDETKTMLSETFGIENVKCLNDGGIFPLEEFDDTLNLHEVRRAERNELCVVWRRAVRFAHELCLCGKTGPMRCSSASLSLLFRTGHCRRSLSAGRSGPVFRSHCSRQSFRATRCSLRFAHTAFVGSLIPAYHPFARQPSQTAPSVCTPRS